MKIALLVLFILGAPAAHGFLFESPGDRALKEAEADRLRTETRMAEQSHGYLLSQAKKSPTVTVRESGVPIWFAVGITVLPVAFLGLLLIREERRREKAERELQQYQVYYGRAHDLLSLEYRNRGGAERVDALLLGEH